MFNFRHFKAVLVARNIEFFRDKASLSWNLIFPVILVVGFSFIFSGGGKAVYKVGLVGEANTIETLADEVKGIKFVDFVSYADKNKALLKLSQHNLDLLIDSHEQTYWVNDLSPKSYMMEKVFLAENSSYQRELLQGQAIRYVDWVLPGILGMNMMFSSLFGVGYVIVRYRKNHVLKRLKATPLSALEFISAQLISRLFIVLFIAIVIYSGCNLFFDFYMLGSYLNLFVIALIGAMSLISFGLLIASRSKSEELVGGLLNLATWPMMMLSEVWFSLEGAPEFVQKLAEFLPLTHLVQAARKVITEGASLAEVSHHLLILLVMSLVFLVCGARLFSWNPER